MLMEVFTRLKPDGQCYVWRKFNLKNMDRELFSKLANKIDANLLRAHEEYYFNKKLECASSIMGVAMNCTRQSPRERSTMKDVTLELEKIRFNYYSIINLHN